MQTEEKDIKKEALVKEMFKLGAHFGYSRSSRHPSAKPFIFGFKNKTTIIDLEKTADLLEKAKDFVRELGKQKKQIIFVGTKKEAQEVVEKEAVRAGMPFVNERWIGGTLTNFKEIRKRIDRLAELIEKEAKGELMVYTKKERLVLAKERKDLERYFASISSVTKMPGALFIVDVKKEKIAKDEAVIMKVPVISLASSDCDLSDIDYPIVANDGQKASIAFFIDQIISAYKEGLLLAEVKPEEKKDEIVLEKKPAQIL